jgi:predicted membrane protein
MPIPRTFICILSIILLYLHKRNKNINPKNLKAMEKTKIKNLKRGDYFTLTPVKEPNISQVWVRGEYIPQAKCYSTYKWEDINHEVIRRGDKEVYTDFTF